MSMIDDFFAVIKQEKLGEVQDVMKSILYVDMWLQNHEGADRIKIENLCYTDKRFQSMYPDIEPVKPSDNVTIARLLCDTLYICLRLNGSDKAVTMTIHEDIMRKVLNAWQVRGTCRRSYADMSECKKIMNAYVGREDYSVLLKVLKERKDEFNDYRNYKDKSAEKKIILPESIRNNIVDPCNYMSDEDFKGYLAEHNWTVDSYADYLRGMLYAITVHNVVTAFDKLSKSNNPLFCTICLQIQDEFKGKKVPVPNMGFPKNCLPMFKEFYGLVFEYDEKCVDEEKLDVMIKYLSEEWVQKWVQK